MTRSFVKEVAVDLDLEGSWLPAPLQPQLKAEGQAPVPKLSSAPEDFGPVMSQAGCHGDVR